MSRDVRRVVYSWPSCTMQVNIISGLIFFWVVVATILFGEAPTGKHCLCTGTLWGQGEWATPDS